MSTAVVFYSATGNSALAAKALAEKLGAKLIELKEKKQRNLSKIGPAFMGAGFQASWASARSCRAGPGRKRRAAGSCASSFPSGRPGRRPR